MLIKHKIDHISREMQDKMVFAKFSWCDTI